MRTFIFSTLLASGLVFSMFALPALAAQDARVTQEEAPVHERPDPTSSVLYRALKGELLRSSDKPINGWYRIRLPQAIGSIEYGWAQSANLTLENELRKELKAAGITLDEPQPRESTSRNWVVSLGYAGYWVNPMAMQAAAGDTEQKAFLSSGYRGEVGFKIAPRWTLSGRYELGKLSRTVSEGNSLSFSGNEAAAQAEYIAHDALRWRVGLTFGLGVSFGNKASVSTSRTVGVRTTVTTVEYTAFQLPVIDAAISTHWVLTSGFGLRFDAGYRYMTRRSIASGADNIDVSLNAPFLAGLLQVEF